MLTITQIILSQISSFVFEKKTSSNNYKVADVIGKQIEKTMNYIKKLIAWTNPDNAEGRVLDWIGRSNGVEREGRDDPSYRRIIKLGQNSSNKNGSHNSIIESFAAAYNIPFTDIEFYDRNNDPLMEKRHIRLVIKAPVSASEAREFLVRVKAAGKIIDSVTVEPTVPAFRFDGVPGEGFNEGVLSDIS